MSSDSHENNRYKVEFDAQCIAKIEYVNLNMRDEIDISRLYRFTHRIAYETLESPGQYAFKE